MSLRIALLVLFMATTGIIGCQERLREKEDKQAPPCDQCPYADAPYLLRCTKCGTEWCSSSPPDNISDCPNCPLDICDETAGLILTIGPLAEFVRHQPDNHDARAKLERAEAKLMLHLDACERCRKSLGEK